MKKEVLNLSRRDLLRAAAAAIPAAGLLAQSRAPKGRIDVHHHLFPPDYLKEMEGEMKANGFAPRAWTPQISLELMDKHDVATAMLSPVQRLVLDSMSEKNERSRKLVRINNDYNAQVVRDHPTRFGLMAALPLPDIDGSLKEIAYAYDTLKADGIALWTSYRDKWPGDPAFEPVFAELNRRKAVVFYHPAAGTCCRNLIQGLGISGIIEYDIDTARCAESMLYGGIPGKYPDIKFIFSHSGGALPTLAARIIDDYPKANLDRLPHGVEYEFKRFYYEVAHASKTAALDAVKDIAPISQILYGADVPLRAYELTNEGLDVYQGFSRADWEAIYRTNSERLFPRLKA